MKIQPLVLPDGSQDGWLLQAMGQAYLPGGHLSPDGRWLFADSGVYGLGRKPAVVDLQSGNVNFLPPPAEGLFAGWLSNMEVTLVAPGASAPWTASVQRVNVTTGKVSNQGEISVGTASPEDPEVWLTADRRAVFIRAGDAVAGLDLTNGHPYPPATMIPFTEGALAMLSPDGWDIAFQDWTQVGDQYVGTARVLDLRQGEVRTISTPHEFVEWFTWSPDSQWVAYSSAQAKADGTFDIYDPGEGPEVVPDTWAAVNLQSGVIRQFSQAGSKIEFLGWTRPAVPALATAKAGEVAHTDVPPDLHYTSVLQMDLTSGAVLNRISFAKPVDGLYLARWADQHYRVAHVDDQGQLRLAALDTDAALTQKQEGVLVDFDWRRYRSSDSPWITWNEASNTLIFPNGREVPAGTSVRGRPILIDDGAGWVVFKYNDNTVACLREPKP